MCMCVLCSMCRFGHAACGGQWWCQQQGDERQSDWAGGERRRGVWCGALPVGADRESSAALPSSASRLHASKFEFLSHTATCNLVCLIQRMLNGAEQPFILLWSPYLCHRAFKLFVCTLCLCVLVCEYVCPRSDGLPGLRILARDAAPFSVSLPFISVAALSCLYSSLLRSSPHSSPKDMAPALILLLVISYAAPLISATSIQCTL